jgi:hypothetical protein
MHHQANGQSVQVQYNDLCRVCRPPFKFYCRTNKDQSAATSLVVGNHQSSSRCCHTQCTRRGICYSILHTVRIFIGIREPWDQVSVKLMHIYSMHLQYPQYTSPPPPLQRYCSSVLLLHMHNIILTSMCPVQMPIISQRAQVPSWRFITRAAHAIKEQSIFHLDTLEYDSGHQEAEVIT